MAAWGDEGPDVMWATLAGTKDGDRCNVVVQVACYHKVTNTNLVVAYPCGTSARVVDLIELKADTRSVTLFNVVCKRNGPIPELLVDENSDWVEHRLTEMKDFKAMVEVCSGIGAATYGFEECGIVTQVACEIRPPFGKVFAALHPEASVIVGDLSDPAVVKQICTTAQNPGFLFSGFSCQPYSRGGNQLGFDDVRSQTLHSSLRIAYLLRIPVVVLECVSEASTNRHVRKQLREFCHQCRYHLSEVYLKLENLWPCRRERWWVVLTASALGPVNLKPIPTHVYPTMVKQLLPNDLHVSADHLAQLELDPEELRLFLKYQPDLTKMLLNRQGVAPTFLHSLGSQVKACECGCRSAGFSDNQLSRGLFGVLCRVADEKGGTGRFRHPHPDEVAILTAVPVPSSWPGSLRLILAGLGQQASPPQSLWIVSQVLQHLEQVVLGVNRTRPRVVLDQYLDRIRLQAKEIVEANNPRPFVPENLGDDLDEALMDFSPSQVGRPVQVQPPDELQWKHFGDESSFSLFEEEASKPLVIRLASPFITVGNLRAAEVGLLPARECFAIVDPTTGEEMSNDTFLSGRSVMFQSFVLSSPEPMEVREESPPTEDVEVPVEISPTVPFAIQSSSAAASGVDSSVPMDDVECGPQPPIDPLAALTPNEFLQLRHPSPNNWLAFEQMIKPQMAVEARLQVMDVQESLWADDEIRWHLDRIVTTHGNPEKVFIDPLLATAVVASKNVGLLYQWMRTLAHQPKVIVTVLLHHQHWIPFAWTWTSECLTSFSWDVHGSQHQFGFLHDSLAKIVGAKTFINHLSYRQFALAEHCGVCAVRWIQNFVSGQMLPTSADEAKTLHDSAREMFVEATLGMGLVSRPWVWGRGLDPMVQAKLDELLLQHGVPKSQLEARSALIVQALGIAPLQKILVSTYPWRNLKAMSNQLRPALQLVLPAELDAVLQQKAASGLANPKRRQKKGVQNNAAPMRPPPIDPAKIRVEEGTFVDPADKPLSQLPVSALGPTATGVAIASYAEVQEFLKVGSKVAPHPLAVFLVNVSEQALATSLEWSQCRVAARCAANGEPMLLQGYLVQLGTHMVVPKASSHKIDIGDVAAACMKATVYRDTVQVSWPEFCKSPVKFLLQWLTPLQTCHEGETCDCGKWHTATDSKVKDPILDVWRRQWLSMSFRPVAPDVAEVFAVNIRFAKSVEDLVLPLSGQGGVFLEPKSLDGKDNVPDFHVVWMPRSTLPELQHLRQTNPSIIGIARMGTRLGLRTSSSDATAVAEQVRPGSIVLSQGARLDFELGPLPFGMDRAAVASLCQNIGWKIKPLNPLRTVTNELGTIWHVQACVDPPELVITTKHGEVVVNRMPSKQVVSAMPVAPVVASSATLKLCAASEEGTDPWLKNDPWAASLTKIPAPSVSDPAAGLKQVEARIEKAILAKLPKPIDAMEVDSSAAQQVQDQRIGALEAQVQKLVGHNQHFEQKLDEVQRRTDAQFAQMHHQVQSQIESQGSHIEELFRGQLAQIENLLGKRARTE